MSLRAGGLLILAMLLACLGCSEGRSPGSRDSIPGTGELGGPDGEVLRCAGCHGTEAPWAPPPDTRGHQDGTYRGVGAHLAHLDASLGRKVACGECHVVPTTVDAAGHLDSPLPAEVTVSGVGTTDGLDPVVEADGDQAQALVTCRNVYCHGASLDGGTRTSPSWNSDEPGRFRQCGACHGMPPARIRSGAAHPTSEACASCHGEVVAPDGTFRNASLHVNGVVEVVAGGACNSCHGNATNAAPPVDTAGRSGTGEVTVGAHQSHLQATLGKVVACEGCHEVPATVDAAGHLDGTPGAEVVFGGLSEQDGATPAWDRGAATCAGSYCHGATLSGGSLSAPKWTVVDGSQKACGTCHGAPPPAPHPQASTCENCHGPTAGPGMTIANAATHIDGQVQVAGGACNSCHGNATNAAPPVDTAGRSGTGEVTVGAHQSHLQATLGKEVGCEACHEVPATVDAAGHLDGTPDAEVVFGGLSEQDGATPAWDRGTATCAGSYCHGATLSGGSLSAPKWTVVDGSQKACGTCHGAPPPSPHPASPICGTCHQDATLDGAIGDASRHIDGTLDVRTDFACNACHGGPDNPAPPRDLEGGDQTTRVTVGAHQPHLRALSALSTALACEDCHQMPGSLEAAGHIDTLRPAEVVFGPRARAGGASPQWNRATGTCSGTYCHGTTLNAGGTATAPLWTRVDGTQDTCTSCHGKSPPTGRHPSVFNKHSSITDCNQCHNGVANATATAITDPTLHIDGTVRVQLKLGGTWNPATRTCDPACHGAETWR